jgi:hypothetical protein
MTYQEVGKEFNLSLPTVGKILKKHGINHLHGKAQMFSPLLKESFFANIETEVQAYFLGLIVADGNIFTKRNRNIVSITLQNQDNYILHKFVRAVQSNKSVTSDGRGCSSIQIHSKKMVEDLKKMGVIENKSLTPLLPNVPEHLYRHMLRGYFDGDGSTYLRPATEGRQERACIAFCGCGSIIDTIEAYLIKNLNLNTNKIDESQKCKVVTWTSEKDIVKLYEFLYHDATIYLTRKKNIITKYLDNKAK